MIEDARSEILASIRRAVQNSKPLAPIERSYRTKGNLNREELINLFEDRLKDYGAGVYRCAPDDVERTITLALKVRNRTNLIADFTAPEILSYAQLDEAEGVLTRCSVAIAETGTIILQHSAANGTRAATLIPDYHLCIVEASQIVETVPEAIERCQPFATSPITTISGPSATSDIQMMRVKGVHGPRVLDVIILG